MDHIILDYVKLLTGARNYLPFLIQVFLYVGNQILLTHTPLPVGPGLRNYW